MKRLKAVITLLTVASLLVGSAGIVSAKTNHPAHSAKTSVSQKHSTAKAKATKATTKTHKHAKSKHAKAFHSAKRKAG